MGENFVVMPLGAGGNIGERLMKERGESRASRWPTMRELVSIILEMPRVALNHGATGEMALTRVVRGAVQDATLRIPKVIDVDAPAPFTFGESSHQLALEVVQRIARLCGPFVFAARAEGPQVLVTAEADLIAVAEKAFGLPPTPEGTTGPRLRENSAASDWLDDDAAQIGVVRHTLEAVAHSHTLAFDFETGSRIVAASAVVAAGLTRKPEVLGETDWTKLPASVCYVLECDRALARTALSRVVEYESELSAAWAKHAMGSEWREEIRRLESLLDAQPPKPYELQSHKVLLLRGLNALPPTSQLFFALWCLNGFWAAYGEITERHFTADAWRLIEAAKAELWEVALGGRARAFPEAIAAVESFDVDPDDYCHEMMLVDHLTSLLKGEYLESATDAGIEMVEFITRHLDENDSTDREQTSPMIAAEVERQTVMLDCLLEGPPTSAMRNAGRESTLFWEE